MEDNPVKRDDQIELLAKAGERNEARVQGWLKNEAVRSFIREFHDRTRLMKAAARPKRACG